MIELTPLDVRKKRGDFRRGMRGYDVGEVDSFLELVAERFEALVKENVTLKERSARLADQVKEQQGREKAVQEALVTAQALREDIGNQAQREADLLRREAEAEIERMILEAENRVDDLKLVLEDLDRRRRRFLRAFRLVLERELDAVHVEQSRDPLEEKPLELELFGSVAGPDSAPAPRRVSEPEVDTTADDTGAMVPEPAGEAHAKVPEDSPAPPAPATDEAAPASDSPATDADWAPHWRFSLGQGSGQGDPGSTSSKPSDVD
jgi:cell division initiation protein